MSRAVESCLVQQHLLHECGKIFRTETGPSDPGSAPITLHRHQTEAVGVAASGASYVFTTGTGSGKSLSYIVPIVDRVLREGSGHGVRAIVVGVIRRFVPLTPQLLHRLARPTGHTDGSACRVTRMPTSSVFRPVGVMALSHPASLPDWVLLDQCYFRTASSRSVAERSPLLSLVLGDAIQFGLCDSPYRLVRVTGVVEKDAGSRFGGEMPGGNGDPLTDNRVSIGCHLCHERRPG